MRIFNKAPQIGDRVRCVTSWQCLGRAEADRDIFAGEIYTITGLTDCVGTLIYLKGKRNVYHFPLLGNKLQFEIVIKFKDYAMQVL